MPKFPKHSIEEKRKRSKLRRKRKKAAKKESGSRDQPFASKKRSDLTDDRSVIQRKDYGKKWSQVAKFFNQGRIEQTVKQLLVQNCQELNSTRHFGTQLQFQYTYTCLKKSPSWIGSPLMLFSFVCSIVSLSPRTLTAGHFRWSEKSGWTLDFSVSTPTYSFSGRTD